MNKTYETSDIALAAYLSMKGIKLLDAKRQQSGKFYFKFDDEKNVCYQASVDFLNSECSRYDSAMKKLKNILYNS